MAAVAVSYPAIAGTRRVVAGRNKWPAWRQAIEAGHWAEVGENTIVDVDPNDSPQWNPNYPSDAPWHANAGLHGITGNGILAWSSGAYDTIRDRFWIHGGGHAAYAGNEPYTIDLMRDAPRWAMRRPPSGAVGNELATLEGDASWQLADGRPISCHTYGNLCIDTSTGNLYRVPSGSMHVTGNGDNSSWRYSLTVEDWMRLLDSGSANFPFSASCYDPTRHGIWWIPHGGGVDPRFYDIDAGTWDSFSMASYGVGSDHTAIYDRPGDAVMAFHSNFANDVGYFNAADPTTLGMVDLVTSGTSPGTTDRGVAYDPERDIYYTWMDDGEDIITLTPPVAGDRMTGTWTWGTLNADAENAVTPSAANGTLTLNRFAFSPFLDCALLLNAANEKIYARAFS